MEERAAGPGRRRARRWILLAALAAVAAGLWFRPYRVECDSMAPAYADGDWVLTAPLWGAPERGAIVVLDAPGGRGRSLKRVVGLPGDRARRVTGGEASIETSRLVWGSEESDGTALPPGHYHVLGDARHDSIDSRHYGPVPRARIQRRVVARLGGSGARDAD